MNWFGLAALFFLLSPGVILTIPAGTKGLFFSCQTSIAAAIIHALVFVLVLSCLKSYGILEGFEAGPAEGTRDCPAGQVRVAGACRSTCLLGKYNKGEKNCY
jgi:hypothetical protein